MAAGSAHRVVCIGIRSWAQRTRQQYQWALSVLADFERLRAVESMLGETLGVLLAAIVAARQTQSTLREYVSMARAAEDMELRPALALADGAGRPTPRQPYIGLEGLAALWSPAVSLGAQAVAALAMLSWGFLLQVSEAASTTLTDLHHPRLQGFCSTKVGGFKHLHRPIGPWASARIAHLQAYAAAMAVPEGQPIFRGGPAYL